MDIIISRLDNGRKRDEIEAFQRRIKRLEAEKRSLYGYMNCGEYINFSALQRFPVLQRCDEICHEIDIARARLDLLQTKRARMD